MIEQEEGKLQDNEYDGYESCGVGLDKGFLAYRSKGSLKNNLYNSDESFCPFSALPNISSMDSYYRYLAP